MTRVLFLGDSAHTGFGTVTWDLGTRLLALGEDVRFISQNQTSEPIPHPLGERTWDADRGVDPLNVMLNGFRDGWRPEAAIILGDFAAVRLFADGRGPAFAQAAAAVPIYHYVPIEGTDLPPAWAKLWQLIRPVAMTDFGADEIAKVTGVRPPVVFHGVDVDTFYPVAANRPGDYEGKAITSRMGAKLAIGTSPDRVLCLRTDRHMMRKQYNLLLRAFVHVFDATPDVDLLIHCRLRDFGGNLSDTLSKLRPEHAKRVLLTQAHDTFRGVPREALNVLYNAADIYVSNSAEGFGLTPAEAIACGVPVVGIDYAAMPEVVGPAGIMVPVDRLVDNEYDHFWASVDPVAYAEQVIRLARKPALRRELGARGPAHIRDHFTWDRAAAGFRDIIAAAAQEQAA